MAEETSSAALLASASEGQKRYPLVYSFNNYSGPVVSGAVLGGLGVHAVNIALGHVIPTDDAFKLWVVVGIVVEPQPGFRVGKRQRLLGRAFPEDQRHICVPS